MSDLEITDIPSIDLELTPQEEIDIVFEDIKVVEKMEYVSKEVMPTPSEDYVGKVFLYVGETNDKYVKGDLYKCVSWTDNTVSPAVSSYYWVDLNTSLYIMPDTAHGYEDRIVRYIGETNDKYTYGKFYEYYNTGVVGGFSGDFRESEIYATKNDVQQKQDKLTAGENITIDENNVISSTGGGGGLSIADLPKFVNKIYINMANATALNGLMSLPCVESSNFIVVFPDGTSQEYIEPTTLIEHQFADANQEGWVYIYGDWKGINSSGTYGDKKNLIIERIVYDNNITEIPNGAFYQNENLISVCLPDTVLRFERAAFLYCKKLSRIELPKNLQYLGVYALSSTALRELTIPASLAPKGSYGTVGDLVLSDTPVNKLVFSEGMQYIPHLFRGNYSITEIVCPKTCEAFGIYLNNNADYGVVSKLVFQSETPPIFNPSAIIGVTTIVVPSKSLLAYKNQTNLTSYANIIYPKGGTYSETITF